MNETLNFITSAISSIGFPIVCCFVLFKQNNKFTETISANTDALNKLAERIDRMDRNDDD